MKKQSAIHSRKACNHRFTIDKEALMKFLGILIFSGYAQLPQRRMFWERDADTNNAAVTATCLETDF